MGTAKKIVIGIIVVIVILVGVGIVGLWVIGAAVVNSSNDFEPISVEKQITDVPESPGPKSIDDISIDPKYNQEELDATWDTPTAKLLPRAEELGEGWSFAGTEYPQIKSDGTKATMWYYHTYYHKFVVTISKDPEFVGLDLSDLEKLFSPIDVALRSGHIISSPDIPPECVVLRANRMVQNTISACIKDDYRILVYDANPVRIDPYGENRLMGQTDYKAVIWISNIILDKMK